MVGLSAFAHIDLTFCYTLCYILQVLALKGVMQMTVLVTLNAHRTVVQITLEIVYLLKVSYFPEIK